MNRSKMLAMIVLVAVIAFNTGCSKKKGCMDPQSTNYNPDAEEDDGSCAYPAAPTSPTAPSTYSFSNVNYSGQTNRLQMMDELSAYMKTGNTSGTVLDALILHNMYSNANSPFSDSTLNSSGKQLRDKTYSLDQNLFDSYLDSLAIISQSTSAGADGVAGVVVSTMDGTKKYLFNERGIEFTQVIEKGLMGAIFYFQASSNYLENIATKDNNSVSAGNGTEMEHNWDEAFGYFGVPNDFPSNTTGIKYWGKYCNARNGVIGSNATIMNAFIGGRFAISSKDYAARDAAKTAIRSQWEKVIAATIISYINFSKTNFNDDAQRNHALSECLGFVMALKYNVARQITDQQINEVLGYIGGNFYQVTQSGLDNAKNTISTIYGLDSVKDQL